MTVSSLPGRERATMRNHHAESGARPLRWLERVLLIAGAATLIWCAVIVGDRVLAQRNALRAMEIARAVDELTRSMTVSSKESAQQLPVDEPLRHVPATIGEAIASLSIPRLQLSAMVLHGSDAQTLQRGPGHLERTALPGDTGNIVIAGHRDSFFRPLRHIQVGDDIFLETREGHFHYRVSSLRVVGPREVSVIAPTSEETLTLITCYPFWVLGNAPDRFVVRAARVDERGSAELTAWNLPVRDWVTSVLHLTRRHEPKAGPIAAPTDDDSLVRQAIRRYLAVAGHQAGACAVNVSGDRASADCESQGQSLSGQERGRRVFELERAAHAWEIRSIVLADGGS
jgi:sortase A